jgi:hypothetical protein
MKGQKLVEGTLETPVANKYRDDETITTFLDTNLSRPGYEF